MAVQTRSEDRNEHALTAVEAVREGGLKRIRAHRQTPDMQVVPVGHMLPQRPQLTAESVRSISQPFEAERSQSANPPAQLVIVHAPAVQEKVVEKVVFGAEHDRPHRPQLVNEVCEFVSHPFAVLPSQSMNPVRQTSYPHTPERQPGTALGTPPGTADGQGHTFPHRPQFCAEVARFTQLFAQLVSPVAQAAAQTPDDEHSCPAQPRRHAPQSLAENGVSQPSSGHGTAQARKLWLHAVAWQFP